jgi:RND family efflux transporter MFP subunit
MAFPFRILAARFLGVALPAVIVGAAEPAPVPVRVETVRFTQAEQAVVYSGTIAARVQAELAFRVGGKIIERPINAGDRVKAGQVLARLDPTDLRLNLDVARQAVASAEADAANAAAERQRYARLGIGSAAYMASEDDRRRAAAQMASARLIQARRQLALAADQLGYAELRADADGAIAALTMQVGQVVQAGQTVAVLSHSQEIEAAVDVPENRLPDVRAADDITVSLWSAPDVTLHGRVREIGALADAASRTFSVKVTLLDPLPQDAGLGMTATVRFARKAGPSVALLPASALADVSGRPAVWVLNASSGHAELRQVDVAALAGDGSVALRGGVSGGEQVVTAGLTGLRADLPVRPWDGPTH